MPEQITYIFTDNQSLFREGVIGGLKPYDLICIGEAGNGKECLELLESFQPDLLLLELEMPVMKGAVAFGIISEKYPRLKVVILTLHGEMEFKNEFMRMGAAGFIDKENLDMDTLAMHLREIYQSKRVARPKPLDRPLFRDSDLRLFPHMLAGKSTKEIADSVGLTNSGVEKKKKIIARKAGVKNYTQLIIWLKDRGFHLIEKCERNGEDKRDTNL